MPVVNGTLRADSPEAWFVNDCGEHSVYIGTGDFDGNGEYVGVAIRPDSAYILAEKLVAAANKVSGESMNPDVRKAIILTVPQGEFFEDNYEAMVAVIEAASRTGTNTITIKAQSKEILAVDHNTKHTFGDQ